MIIIISIIIIILPSKPYYINAAKFLYYFIHTFLHFYINLIGSDSLKFLFKKRETLKATKTNNSYNSKNQTSG